MGVVTVVVGVDQGADGEVGHALDGGEEGAGSGFGEAGIHNGDGVCSGDEAGIVQAPTAVQLYVGIYPGTYFFQ